MRTQATAIAWLLGAMTLGCSRQAAAPAGPSSPAPAGTSESPEASATIEWLHLPSSRLSAPAAAGAGSVGSSRARGFDIDELRVGSTTILVWIEHDVTPETAMSFFEEGALDAETANVTALDDGVMGIYERPAFTSVQVFRMIDGQPIYCEGRTSAPTKDARAKDERRILEMCQSLRSDGASTAEYWLSALGLVIVAPKGAELTDSAMTPLSGEDSATLELPGFTLFVRRRHSRREASDAPAYDGHVVTKVERGFEFTVETANPPKFTGYYDVEGAQFMCVLKRFEPTTELSQVRDVCRTLRPDGTAEAKGTAHGRSNRQ